MAEEDTPQDKANRERVFKHFDQNGDGKISSSELQEALKALGSVRPDAVTLMMAEIDTDGDGFISFQEFTAFAIAHKSVVKDIVAQIP